MKKILLLFFIFMLISFTACQQTFKKEVEKKGEIKKMAEIPKVETKIGTGDSVEDIGNAISDAAITDSDLNSDNLGDLDTGLGDIQNI